MEMNREMVIVVASLIFFVIVVIFAIANVTGVVPRSIFHGSNIFEAAWNGMKSIIGL